MKTWTCSILTFLVFTLGCAQGYADKRPAYTEPTAAPKMESTTFENPETAAERQRRIWGEERGR